MSNWTQNSFLDDNNSYYASPVFKTSTSGYEKENKDETALNNQPFPTSKNEIPAKAAPKLRRSSTCRPTSTLYLPYKKKKNDLSCCLRPLSRLEIILLVLLSILTFSFIGIISCWVILFDGYNLLLQRWPLSSSGNISSSIGVDKTAIHHNDIVCTSRECVLLSGFLAGNLNDKVDPCEDFYEFACGNYGLNRNLPANKPLRHTISDVQSRLNKQVKSILQLPVNDHEAKWDKLAKKYYQKCLDEDELEQTGSKAVLEVLDWVGGWPTLQHNNWTEWNYSWEEQLAIVMNKTGVNAVILELAVTHDPSNSSKSVIELDQPKWGIGSRWPYLAGSDDPMIKNYTHLMKLTAVALGADPEIAERDMVEAMELELKLVNFSAEEMVRRDPERGNNRYQLWQLKKHFPLIDFEKYIRRIFHDLVDVSPNHTIIIRETEYFSGIQHILNSTPKRVIANYIAWRIVQGFSPFLPPRSRLPFYQFKANQTGMFNSPPPDRWEDCVTLSVIMLDMPVGKLFVENFFEKQKAMEKMSELTTFLKAEFIKQLHILDWMDNITRKRAIEKAGMIEYKNGFPELLFNNSWMDEHWGMAVIDEEHLLHFTIRIKLTRYTEELLRLDQTLDRTMWYQSPAQVDAYYAPNNNEMIFPAGIMQFPFLTIGVPNYITFGMVGAVIGHEVSHAFDDQGGQYDELGNLNDWWDAETAEKFAEKTRCFINQYSSVKVEEAGIHLNGQLSLGENIADNGGVKTAFNAYKAWKTNTSGSEPALPGFQNYTSEQMFFLAYANNWCSVVRAKHYIQIIITDVHAPSKYRAIIPLQNRPEFASAFKCSAGSTMNPEKKCQVW